jgi:hypothetical protein
MTVVTATGSWSIVSPGWQFAGGQQLYKAHSPFFGAAWDDVMVACWSANPRDALARD